MDYSNLNDQEIKALLMQYDSEMRKLSFQMQIIQSTIQKLHESLNATAEEKAVAAPISTETVSEIKETAPVVKVNSGVEYPKKRAPKINLEEKTVEITEPKKRGPKPKVKTEAVVTEPKKRGPKPKVKTETTAEIVLAEPKKRGPKPKVKTEAVVTEPKKRGPKAKVKTETTETVVAEPKRRGPKPKAKAETAVKEPKKRGPKAKDKTLAEPKKRGPKAKVKAEKGKRKYTKENPWPDFITATLEKYKHVLSSAQLYEMAEEENKIKNYGLDDKDVRAMVSRAFHQLSNMKKSIAKFDIKGSKSYNYALVNWLDNNGEVKSEFQA